MTTDQAARRRPEPVATAAACGGLLILFATLACTAVLTKSATWDEPENLLGAYLHTHYRDFRVNPEDPALFGWIAGLPLGRGSLHVDLASDTFKGIADTTSTQWGYVIDTLYHTRAETPWRRCLWKTRSE